MPAFLSPNGKNRIVVDRIITLGQGKMVGELQGQFFGLNGDFLEDMSVAEAMPEPFRTRAIKFVTEYKAAKAKGKAEEKAVVDEEKPQAHELSDELKRVLHVATSEERAQEE